MPPKDQLKQQNKFNPDDYTISQGSPAADLPPSGINYMNIVQDHPLMKGKEMTGEQILLATLTLLGGVGTDKKDKGHQTRLAKMEDAKSKQQR